jgi:hypothetical protein
MIPIGGLIGLGLYLARNANRPAGAPPTAALTGMQGLRVLGLVLGAPFAVLDVFFAIALHPLAVPITLALSAVVFPLWWATVAAALGWPRVARLLAQASLSFESDRVGGPLAVAARGAGHARDREAAMAWLEKALAAQPLRGGSLLASALLVDLRGDREGARALASSVALLSPATQHTPKLVRAWAHEWLAAEAASRGAWEDVRRHSDLALPQTPTGALLQAFSLRMLGRPVAPVTLWWRWLRAPYRLRTWPRLHEALAFRAASQLPLTPAAPPPGDPLGRALQFHAEVAAQAAPTAESLALLGALWDEALQSPAVADRLAQRAKLVGGDAVAAQFELRREAEGELTALAERLPGGLHEASGELLETVARSVRAQRLAELEQACVAMGDRTKEKRELPVLDEWRELLEVHRRYERVVAQGDESTRRLAFQTLHDQLNHWGAWVWNARNERALANALFRWLHAEAVLLNDLEAMELQGKNAKLAF